MHMREIMNRLNEDQQFYYHGSYEDLPVGTVLTPRENYEENWQHTDFYHALEKYRPNNMLAHKDAVFLCDNPEDIDVAGGATDYLLTVIPHQRIERHDLNWGSEISGLISDGYDIDSPEVKSAAQNYWNGIPSENEVVWEYLTPSATIVKSEEY